MAKTRCPRCKKMTALTSKGIFGVNTLNCFSCGYYKDDSNEPDVRGLKIKAKLQAKVWRNQLRNKHKDTVAKELLGKLNAKFPELPQGDLRHIALQVI